MTQLKSKYKTNIYTGKNKYMRNLDNNTKLLIMAINENDIC